MGLRMNIFALAATAAALSTVIVLVTCCMLTVMPPLCLAFSTPATTTHRTGHLQIRQHRYHQKKHQTVVSQSYFLSFLHQRNVFKQFGSVTSSSSSSLLALSSTTVWNHRPLFMVPLFVHHHHHDDYYSRRFSFVLHSKRDDQFDNEDDDNDNTDSPENDQRDGMAEAFRELDALSLEELSSLDDEDLPTTPPSPKPPASSSSSSSSNASIKPEEELKVYTKMYNELETEGEEKMYESVLEEMGGGGGGGGEDDGSGDDKNKESSTSTSNKKKNQSLEDAMSNIEEELYLDADGIGDRVASSTASSSSSSSLSSIPEPDMDEFMNRALSEALEDVKKREGSSMPSAESLLTDEEMKNEIEKVFERANEKLRAGLEEMRKEQAALTEKSAKARTDALIEEEERLAEAEAAVTRMVGNVKRETAEVEKAVADLKKAQEKMNADPLMKMADLKGAGPVKQAAFVGAILFSIRAVSDAVLMGGADGEVHMTAAFVQGVIALVCAAYFFFF